MSETEYGTYRYFIYLAYDGTAYHGWQRQPNGISVQVCIEKALSLLLRCDIAVTGAGRTDAGVHARLMVAHADIPYSLDDAGEWVHKLNRVLPPDIVIYRIRPVKPDAHSRFDALSRTYRYYISYEKNPVEGKYRWTMAGKTLNIDRMNEAAGYLLQYTDFTSFSKLHTDVKTNNCRITHAVWTPTGNDLVFEITADRFLRNMVRAIVGTLVEVGRGKLSIKDFRSVIEARDRCKAGTSAPGNALFLTGITYPEELFLR